MQDTEEFAKLVTSNQRRLHAHIYSLLGNDAASWDVLQETNLVLWRKRDEFEPGTDFCAWAHTVARFQVMAFLRDRKREPLCILTPEIYEAMQKDEGLDEAEDVEGRLKALKECLKQLAPKAAAMVQLHYHEKHPLSEVGTQMGMSANAVKQSLFRARKNLQACIENSQ